MKGITSCYFNTWNQLPLCRLEIQIKIVLLSKINILYFCGQRDMAGTVPPLTVSHAELLTRPFTVRRQKLVVLYPLKADCIKKYTVN